MREQHLPLATAQTGIDLGLFDFLSQNSEKAFTVTELAEQTHADPVLLSAWLAILIHHGDSDR